MNIEKSEMVTVDGDVTGVKVYVSDQLVYQEWTESDISVEVFNE